MDPSLYKSFQTTRSYTYTYYSSVSPTSHQKQTLLFLHGFPEYADSWAAQVQSFNALGYACIVPDLLGYGGTSKPTDTEAYNSEGLSQDIADILTNENVDRAIIIGHDWGAYLAGRFANWQPARTLGLVVTSVAYRAAAELDLDASNAALKKSFGFEPFGYWSWIASPEAPAVIEAHLESFYSLLFAENPEIWKVCTPHSTHFHPRV
jgi:soluble epoxide hydrolase / lipid-phosphate phosphatase